jgi:hypothetical protein
MSPGLPASSPTWPSSRSSCTSPEVRPRSPRAHHAPMTSPGLGFEGSTLPSPPALTQSSMRSSSAVVELPQLPSSNRRLGRVGDIRRPRMDRVSLMRI